MTKNQEKLSMRKEIEEEVDIFKYFDIWEVIYMCFHSKAFGCQKVETGHCDHGESCMDI